MSARKKQSRKPWTREEVRILEQHAHEGAAALKKMLPGRSEKAIRRAAERYGISIVRRWHCPLCNKYVYRPLRPSTGWCDACSKRETIARNQQITRELKLKNLGVDGASETMSELDRQLDATYQENSRLRRSLKHKAGET